MKPPEPVTNTVLSAQRIISLNFSALDIVQGTVIIFNPPDI